MESSSQIKVAYPEILFGPSNRMRTTTPIQTIVEYSYNGVGSLWVLGRDGVSHRINSYTADRHAGDTFGFTINKLHRNAVDVQTNIHRESMLEGNRNMVVYENLLSCPNRGQYRELHVTYFVPDAQLSDAGGVLYIAEFDIVLSTVDPILQGIVHPYSVAAAFAERDGVINSNTLRGTTARWFIVDNEGICGTRYMQICGEVVCIRTRSNGTLESGLYFQLHDEQSPTAVKRFFPIKDVIGDKLPFKLFDSADHAISYNETHDHEVKVTSIKRDTEEYRQQNQLRKELSNANEELVELRNQLLNQNSELTERFRKEAEAVTSRLAAAYKEREQEMLAREQEMLRRAEERTAERLEERARIQKERDEMLKDIAEQAKVRRQHTLEIIKSVPVVLGIALTVMQLFLKAKSK